MRIHRSGILAVVAVLLAVLTFFTACEQNSTAPLARSLTVMVKDISDAKTISPAGNVNVSHYIITVSNQDTGDSVSSGYLAKGQAFTVMNIAVGTWTAKVDAYVQNEYASGGYVHIATATSDPVRVSVDSEAKITVTLDEILVSQSDDVAVTLMLPSDFVIGSNVYAIWTLDGNGNDYFIGWDKALELQVTEDRTVTFTLDADNLLGGSEKLMQGVYTISVEVADSKETGSQTVVKKGVEILRLLAGLPASGVINISIESIVPDGAGIEIVEQIGDQLQLGAIATVQDQLVTVDLIYNGIPADVALTVYIDGAKLDSGNYGTEDLGSGKRVLIDNAPTGEHLIMFTVDDGTTMGKGSLTVKVVVVPPLYNWTLVDMPGFESGTADGNIYGIAYGNDKFVAVGGFSSANPKAAYSTDGIKWTSIENTKAKGCASVSYVNDRFIIGGMQGDGSYSFDGINWTAIDMNVGTHRVLDVVYADGKYVAVGQYGYAAYSTDGITWKPVAIGAFEEHTYYEHIYSVVFGNGRFVVGGGKGRVAYSTDGVNWTSSNPISSVAITDIVYANGKFVAVAGYSCFYSTDGINWNETYSVSPDKNALVYANDKFVVVGNGCCLYSIDGIDWNVSTNDITSPFNNKIEFEDIAYGKDKFVAVGQYGYALYCVDEAD